VFAHNKNTQRRLGLLGGVKRNNHVNQLCAQWLLDSPTMDKLLKALAQYRKAARGTRPDEAYESFCTEWLFGSVYR
jgi:hypothetical protein